MTTVIDGVDGFQAVSRHENLHIMFDRGLRKPREYPPDRVDVNARLDLVNKQDSAPLKAQDRCCQKHSARKRCASRRLATDAARSNCCSTRSRQRSNRVR